MPDISHGQEEYILVVGATGSGKTTFVNAATGSDLQVGHGLESCTSKVALSKPLEIVDRKVILFDTPGFDDTNKEDAEIWMDIATFVQKYNVRKRLMGVIFLHDISKNRMGRSAVRNIKAFRIAVGEGAASNVVIVTTMWKGIDDATGALRTHQLETNPAYFQPFISAGAVLMAHKEGDNPLGIINKILENRKPIPLEMLKDGKAFKYRIVKWFKGRG